MTASDLRTRHPWIPGFRWITLDETFVIGTPACRPPYPSKPHFVVISHFFPQEETVNDNLPLSPAISQWLDVHSDILQGKGGLGKTQRASPYVKGQYPRFPALSPGRYLPVDVDKLFT